MQMRASKRLFASLWAVLQFALPMAVLWGDAFDARDSVGRDRTHIESSTSPNCRAPHPEECALCRFLAHSHGAPSRGTVAMAFVRAALAPVSPSDQLHATLSLGLPSSRAPPIS